MPEPAHVAVAARRAGVARATETRPLRVLVTVDAVGGVWNYALDLARALPAEGIAPLLALLGPPPSAAQAAQARALGLTLVETGLGLDWVAPDAATVAGAARRLAELAGDVGADVAQINMPALAAARFAMPVLAVAHSCLATWWDAVERGAPPAAFAWRDRLTRAGLHAATRVAAPSRAHAAATMRAHGLAMLPDVIHNGRTPPAVGTGTGSFRGAPGRFVFTHGRLCDRGKDVATLDAAAALLDAPFEAAGPLSGPDGEVRAFANLACLGTLPERALAARLAQRPVFASAARYEPFGLAVLEAAQAGCALVLADTPVFRELWGGAATFVPAGDAPRFARAIAALLDDPAARAAAGDAARRAAGAYGVRAMAKRTAALHRALGGGKRAAA